MKVTSSRNRPDEIIIHPFGKIDQQLIDTVKVEVADRFQMKVSIGRDLVVPARAYSANRDQYRSTLFLDEMARPELDLRKIRLGITSVDLFAPELNFVFGEASSADRVAVFSIARLDASGYWGRADPSLLVKRAATEAVHELGHVLGLGHCRNSRCVMWFSNTLSETDRKGSHFCKRCAEQLAS